MCVVARGQIWGVGPLLLPCESQGLTSWRSPGLCHWLQTSLPIEASLWFLGPSFQRYIFLGSSNQSGERFRLLGPNLTAVTSRSFTPRLKMSESYGGQTRAHPGQVVSQDRAMTLLLPCSFWVPRLGSWDVTTWVCTPHMPCSVHVRSALLCCM